MSPIVPEHTAVLVIDVQTGLFRSQPPPVDADGVVARINGVTAEARAAGAPVIFIQHEGDASGDWLVPGSEGWELDPALKVEPGETVFRKTTCDAFYETPLEAELGARRISTLVLTGFATDFCVDTTLRVALSKEFEVVVVADAHTTTDGPSLSAESLRRHFNWAWENCASRTLIRVLRADEISFAPRA